MAETIFSKIVAGEIPCHRIYESEHVLAFLDINPLSHGHTLVIPKRAVGRYEELTPAEAAELGQALLVVAQQVLAATGATDYNLLQNNGRASGQEIEHVHFHVIPRQPGDGLGYRWHPQQASQDALAELAQKIQAGGPS